MRTSCSMYFCSPVIGSVYSLRKSLNLAALVHRTSVALDAAQAQRHSEQIRACVRTFI